MRERDDSIMADLVAIKAEETPDLDVVTFEGAGVREDEVRTYAQLHENANRIAADLISKGMEPGDRFAILIRNHPEFIEMMIAASITACAFVPIDPRTRGDKLAYTLNNSEARGIYCADYSLSQVEEIRDKVPNMTWISVMETGEDEGGMLASEVAGAENFAAVMDLPAKAVDVRLSGPGDMFQIIYTSGTTGDPKGVVMPNDRFGMIAKMGPWIGLTPEDRPYTGLSLTHGNAQMLTLAFAMGMGLHAVFSRKFTKSRLWDICRQYGCTTFNLLGGMSTAVYSDPEKANDADNPVRFVLSAGMPASIWEKFEKRFNVEIVELYGAVEGGLALKKPGEGPVGSFGKPPPTSEMKIVDEDGNAQRAASRSRSNTSRTRKLRQKRWSTAGYTVVTFATKTKTAGSFLTIARAAEFDTTVTLSTPASLSARLANIRKWTMSLFMAFPRPRALRAKKTWSRHLCRQTPTILIQPPFSSAAGRNWRRTLYPATSRW